MSARNGASLSWLRLAGLALAGFASQALQAQEPAPVDESPERYLSASRVQLEQLDYSGAKHSLDAAVSIIERRSGAASVELIDPLVELARVFEAMSQPEQAAEALRRAATIIKRSEGLYSVRQYPLLLELVDLDSAAGRLDAARSGLMQASRVVERVRRDDWRAHASSLGEIGGWLCRIGDFAGARRTYRQALGMLESRNDAALQADTMVAFARCCLLELSAEGVETAPGTFDHYRGRVQRTERMNPENPAFRAHVSRLLRWDGEQALRRAAAIAESGRLEPRHAMSVLLQAGDWFQTKDHYRAARTYYSRADAIALSLNAESPLAAPVQVLYPIPALVLRARGAPPVEGADRSVEVEFRVQADGSIDSEKVVDRELGKSIVDEVLSALRVARYRPRFEAGQAVDTDGVRRRQPIPQMR